MTKTRRFGMLLSCLLLLFASAPQSQASPGRGPLVTIRYTEHGIPHIVARDHGGLGYGYGYASATDNVCTLAETYVTVNAERSLFFGPDAPAQAGITTAGSSLNSDLHFQRINDSGIVDGYARSAPSRVRDLVRGFADGYNHFLRDNRVSDPACAGAPWVRAITEQEVYRYAYAVALLAGSGALIDELVTAEPPSRSGVQARSAPTADALVDGIRASDSGNGNGSGNGSNAIAIGAEGTRFGKGVLLANPHFPWKGALRFWQSHLTVPGELNVSGASLAGLPVVAIGHNADVAWSHTVSTAATVGLFEVRTVPGSPTRYLVDGRPQDMVPQAVTVRVRGAHGSTSMVTRTLWSTRYGPVLSGLSGVALPWGESAYALRDANATNFRLVESWLGLGQARSVEEIQSALSTTLGVPWTNTLAVDRRGRALYADIQVVPHVTDDHAARCNTALGAGVFARTGVSILDGSRGSCEWGSDSDAPVPGLLGPDRLPALVRGDYVANANNAPWLANPAQPLTSYPRVVGPVGGPPSLRAQQALRTVQRRLDGTDGLPGKGFSSRTMRDVLFADQSRAAEIGKADVLKMCAAFPPGQAPSSGGPVDARAGCAALARWQGDYRLDSEGSLLFSRFVLRLGSVPGGPWRVPFDPARPLTTPNTLAIDRGEVRVAFGDAVRELAAAGVPVGARLGDNQHVTRDGARIPIHGAPHELGVLNVITPVWAPGGNTDVVHGSSFIQVVEFGGHPSPRTYSLLAYSQSADASSPHNADQTRLYSSGTWVRERFTETEIRHSPALRIVEFRR
ncbi:penicillin acylase family protein [Actinokineospora sp. G85]|uniref:penicillin acylase family protein n=1 Tax=Actinokineospora sp. G85 TaxID=3406626 RepID=UPI003C732D89